MAALEDTAAERKAWRLRFARGLRMHEARMMSPSPTLQNGPSVINIDECAQGRNMLMAHNDDGVAHAGDEVELGLENKREGAESAPRDVDSQEQEGDTADLLVFPYLIILWAENYLSVGRRRREMDGDRTGIL